MSALTSGWYCPSLGRCPWHRATSGWHPLFLPSEVLSPAGIHVPKFWDTGPSLLPTPLCPALSLDMCWEVALHPLPPELTQLTLGHQDAPVPQDPLASFSSVPFPKAGTLPSCAVLTATCPPLQGTLRPTRSLSTAQLGQPSGGLQASVISNIVLMKGQAKVGKGHCWWDWGQQCTEGRVGTEPVALQHVGNGAVHGVLCVYVCLCVLLGTEPRT